MAQADLLLRKGDGNLFTSYKQIVAIREFLRKLPEGAILMGHSQVGCKVQTSLLAR